MKDTFEKFLVENNLYPLQTWNNFKLDCRDTVTEEERLILKARLKELLYDLKGIYVITDSKKTLYIGEGILRRRLWRHYCNTHRPDRRGYWFFNKFQCEWNIYWLQFDNVYERRALEAMLTVVLNPMYNDDLTKKSK